MTIIGQSGGMIGAIKFGGTVSHKIKVKMQPHYISAEIASSFLGLNFGSHYSWLGIAEIESKAGKEVFAGNGNGIYTSIIFRDEVTSVTFGAVAYNCQVWGRFIINYWK